MRKVYLLLAAVIFSFCSAFAEEVELTQSMFKGWDGFDASATVVNQTPYWDASPYGTTLGGGGVVFGSGNVANTDYADLSEYEKVIIFGDNVPLRFMFNRQADNSLIELNPTATPEGVEIDLSSYSYVHLNAIKVSWGVEGSVTKIILVKSDTPEPEPEPEPVAPAAQEEVTDLTKDMFKEWTLPTIGAEEKGPGYGAYEVGISTGMPYGDGNVDKNHYADVSAYDYLDITVKEGTPRPLFNRDIDGGQAPDHLIDMPNNAAQTAKYRTETTNADGTKTYRFALNTIMADYGYVHLHAIKGANWANVTVTAMKLVKIVETAANFKLKDIKAEADKTVFIGTILGANTISVENEVTNIRNFNGDIVTPAKLSTNAGKLIITTESPLPRGDYRVHIVPGILKLNGNIYEGALDCILAVGEKDEAALNAYENDFANEIETASVIKEDLIYGVNLFQYAPGLKKKIQAAMDEAEYYAELLVEEEHIYNTIADLRKFMKSLRPILPQTDKEYCIKHQGTGLYLNISGEDVVLSEKPTPVQFHLVEPSEGPWCWQNDHYYYYGDWEQTYRTYHYSYIYTTPERKYLGFNMTEREVGEDDAKYTEVIPTTTNQKNTIWWIGTYSTNEYYIELPDKYTDKVDYLFAPKDSEEGAAVTCYDEDIDWDKERDNRMTEPGWLWFIEDYIAPEVTEEPSNLPEGYVAITNEADLEGQTVILMNAETEEFIYGIDAQNIAVADFETATASTNVVTSYKIEKADNGYLFRCVTPAGADYSLWGANPCYFNAQKEAGGVTFNLGKDQDIANGSTWSLTYDEEAKAWIVQSVANEAYLAGNTISAELTAKWVICATTGDNSSSEEVTSISSVEAAANATAIYNAAGARTNTLQKGINIVKMANGKVVKIMK